MHLPEFVLSQTDKQVAFQKVMITNIKQNRTKEQLFELARRFLQEGRIDEDECRYQTLDKKITHASLTAAKKVRRRKYGYMRNSKLTTCDRMVFLY